MLSQLSIKEFVTISELAIEFQGGMTALTGETGAGKSILVDALGLVLGERANASLLAEGAERTEITASFDISDSPGVRDMLVALDLSTDEQECILRRTVSRDGRSRAYVNGSPAPLQTLREVGQYLVDVHGQNTHLSLLRSDGQRGLLDDFGGHQSKLAEVAACHRNWVDAQTALENAVGQINERESRLDFVRFQLQELHDAKLEAANEFESLGQAQRRLSNAVSLRDTSERLREQLAGEPGASVREVLHNAAAELAPMVELDQRLAPVTELIGVAVANVEEAAAVLRDYGQDSPSDDGELGSIEQRLTLLHDLARKHRVKPDELVERQGQLEREFAALDGAEANIETLRLRVQTTETNYLTAARNLHKTRRTAATKLAKAVSQRLSGLGIQGGALRIDIQADATRAAHGTDRVEFHVRTNPGRAFGPLSKIASGGELSRIGLAIHVVAASAAHLPCLIFDEVDAGIGGEIAIEVGRYLRELATLRQVLCVTHLPQVAAHATHHLFVEKKVRAKSASTEIRTVADEKRVAELARMLGGKRSRQSLEHAKEMLASSQRHIARS